MCLMTKEEFKQMRLDAGASQSILAKTLSMHPITISKIERGLLKPFDLRLRLEEIVIAGIWAGALINTLNIKKIKDGE
jgi:DNA-binding XRE family transcriptional regulator